MIFSCSLAISLSTYFMIISPFFSRALFFVLLGFAGFLHAQDNPHKTVIQKLTSIFENSTTDLQYDYVENIKDGRGYTFGFAGFCSGTYDGTKFLKEYQRLNPNNPLIKFIPIFEQIDAGPHDAEGKSSDTKGLDDFPKAFQACADDPAFKQAQQNIADQLYWTPSQVMAAKIGARYVLTEGELYDAYINHGEDAVTAMIQQVNQAVGGSPNTGVDEKKWLEKFLQVRLAILKADPTWDQAIDRIAVYQKLLAEGNVDLALPIKIKCYGDHYTIK